MTVETSFTHQWIFKRSGSKQNLKIVGNGVVAQIFEGCRFGANANERILVTISYHASSSSKPKSFTTTADMASSTNQTEKTIANSRQPSTTSHITTTMSHATVRSSTTSSPQASTMTITTETIRTTFTTMQETASGK